MSNTTLSAGELISHDIKKYGKWAAKKDPGYFPDLYITADQTQSIHAKKFVINETPTSICGTHELYAEGMAAAMNGTFGQNIYPTKVKEMYDLIKELHHLHTQPVIEGKITHERVQKAWTKAEELLETALIK